MKKYLIGGIIIIAIILGFQFFTKSPNLGGSVDWPIFDKMATSSAITVGTSSTLVQATTTRQYMVIVNDGSNVVYLALNGDAPAIANSGIRLNASGGNYELTPEDANLYQGAIRAIAVGGSSVITVSGK